MDDGPAIRIGCRITEWRVSSDAKSDCIIELCVRLCLNILALQARGQRIEALPHGPVAVGIGSVAHDTEVTIGPLSLVDGCPFVGQGVLEILEVRLSDHLQAAVDGNRPLDHFGHRCLVGAHRFLVRHPAIITARENRNDND